MQYIKFDNEKNPTDFTLMVPLSSYDIISTDTTCGLVNSIRDFFKNVEESLNNIINGNYSKKIQYKAETYLNHIKSVNETQYATNNMPKSNARVIHLAQLSNQGTKALPNKMVAFKGNVVDFFTSELTNNLKSRAISQEDFSKEILENIGSNTDLQVQEKLRQLEYISNYDIAKQTISIIGEALSKQEQSNLLKSLELNEESKETLILQIENVIRLRNILNAVFCLCTEKFKQNENFMRQDLASHKNKYGERNKIGDKEKYLYTVETVTATRHKSNLVGGINEATEIRTKVIKFNYEFMNEMIALMRNTGICFTDDTPEEYDSIIRAVIASIDLDITKLQEIKDPVIAILKSQRTNLDKRNYINNCIQFVYGLIKIHIEDQFGLKVGNINSRALKQVIINNFSFNLSDNESITFDTVYEYLISSININVPEQLFDDKFKEDLKESIYQRWNRIVDDQLHFDEFLVLSDNIKGEYVEFQHKLSCSYEFYAKEQLNKPIIFGENILRKNAISNIALFTSFALISITMIAFNSQLTPAFKQGLLGKLLFVNSIPLIQILIFSLAISIIIKLAIDTFSKYENTTYDALKNSIMMFVFLFITLTIISMVFPVTLPYLALGFLHSATNIKGMLLCVNNTSLITVGVVRLAMFIIGSFKYQPPSLNTTTINPVTLDNFVVPHLDNDHIIQNAVQAHLALIDNGFQPHNFTGANFPY